MIIGSAWTKEATDGGKTKISIALDETFLEFVPQLKDVGIFLRYVSKEERKNENSPGWTVIAFKKGKDNGNTTTTGDTDIPL